MSAISVVRLLLTLDFIFWCNGANGDGDIDWGFRQRFKAMENSIVHNENLGKFIKNDSSSIRCIHDLQWIRSNVAKKWAFEMLDAWGKLPSGDFEIDYGSFDQCLNMQPMISSNLSIRSQYCLFQFNAIDKNPQKLAKTKTSSMKLGICIPDSCAPKILETIIKDYLNAADTISITAFCQSQDEGAKQMEALDKFMIGLMISILSSVILCTIYDIICDWRKMHKGPILKALSAFSNGRILFSCESSPNVISCLYGIRAIAAQFIILIHFAQQYPPSTLNGFESTEFVEANRYLFDGAGTFSVDTFFVLSGFLAASSILSHLSEANGRLELRSLFQLYFHRCLRIMPVLTFIVAIHLSLLKFIPGGPSSRKFDFERLYCEQSMWRTLFFVNNFYYTNKCVGVSWYLSTDMQLYILAPLLVIQMQRNAKRFVIFSILAIILNVVSLLECINFNPFGWEIGSATYFRFPPWLIGVNFAHIVQKYRFKNFSIPKRLNILALIGSVLTFYLVVVNTLFGPLGKYTYGRIFWSLALCYIIFSCKFGYGGIIDRFLSLRHWQPLSRLSFVVYLIHVEVRTFLFTNSRTGLYFSKFEIFQSFLLVSGLSTAVAVLISLAIEMPIAALQRTYSSKAEPRKYKILCSNGENRRSTDGELNQLS